MIFPETAVTKTTEIINVGSSTIETYPSYIYGVAIQQSGSQSETSLLCGSERIIHNYGTRDLTLQLIQYKCDNYLIMNKTGVGDKAFMVVTYSTSTPTSTPDYLKFTGGEIIITIMLLWIFLFMAFSFFVARFFGILFIRKR